MELTVVPDVDEPTRRALLLALRDAGVYAGPPRYDEAWRRTALSEGVERDDPEASYALSPRSTRGATRA